MLSPHEKEQQRQAEEAIHEASLTVPRRLEVHHVGFVFAG